jgi:DNA polymerase elongation subunit (family B)
MARRTNPMKILYLDIETAPADAKVFSLAVRYINPKYITKPGYTLCWAAKWEGSRDILYSGLDITDEADMIASMHDLLMQADAVVHYNGTKFDMPTLNREFIKGGLPPVSHVHEIDLLKTVRKRFRFESNKLDYVCRMLGIGAKEQHKGIQLWYECMEGNMNSWRKMQSYNKQDVRLLPKLYKRLLPWITGHPNVGLYKESKLPVCMHCGSTNLVELSVPYTSKTLRYQAYTCNTCQTPLRSNKSEGQPQGHLTVRIN